MQVEDFLDFREPNYIRLKGSRMGLNDVLRDYLDKGDSADVIATRYGVPLTGVYASILYYQADPEKVGKYLQNIIDEGEAAWQEQQRNPTPGMLRMRRLAAMSRASGLPLCDPNNPVHRELEREKAATNSKSDVEVQKG